MKRILSTNNISIFIIICIFSVLFSCKTLVRDQVAEEYESFLRPDPGADEVFRVLIISDKYESSQMKFQHQFKRVEDEEGDKNICNKLKEYDKIDETCEGVLSVWLYPESGKLMKIRPKTLASIAEINSLIVEDLKRWDFEFSTGSIEPNSFDIKYRVVLRKIQSDEEIMKEVMERAREEEQKKGLKSAD